MFDKDIIGVLLMAAPFIVAYYGMDMAIVTGAISYTIMFWLIAKD